MANYSGTRAVHQTLGASTVDTVTLALGAAQTAAWGLPVGILVINRNGSAEIYFTVDGTTPTVGGANSYVVPASIGSCYVQDPGVARVTVNLISSGTPTYSVELI